MKLSWMNPVAPGNVTWKIARSVVSQTSWIFVGTAKDFSFTPRSKA